MDYFSQEWFPEQEATIENHLADCDMCAQRASAVFEVLGLTDTWTAPAQAKSFQARPESAHWEYAGSTRSA